MSDLVSRDPPSFASTFNHFAPNVPFLYLLKTLENLTIF